LDTVEIGTPPFWLLPLGPVGFPAAASKSQATPQPGQVQDARTTTTPTRPIIIFAHTGVSIFRSPHQQQLLPDPLLAWWCAFDDQEARSIQPAPTRPSHQAARPWLWSPGCGGDENAARGGGPHHFGEKAKVFRPPCGNARVRGDRRRRVDQSLLLDRGSVTFFFGSSGK